MTLAERIEDELFGHIKPPTERRAGKTRRKVSASTVFRSFAAGESNTMVSRRYGYTERHVARLRLQFDALRRAGR